MPIDPTPKQSAASSRNARKATAAKIARAGERREAAKGALLDAYEPVTLRITYAIQAALKGQPERAAGEVQVALLTLAEIAAVGTFDPVRHRACMLALRECVGRNISDVMGGLR